MAKLRAHDHEVLESLTLDAFPVLKICHKIAFATARTPLGRLAGDRAGRRQGVESEGAG